MRYLAIGYWADKDSNQTFSLSRETNSISIKDVIEAVCVNGLKKDTLDTVLLLKSNVHGAPEVIHHWSAQNGDFE